MEYNINGRIYEAHFGLDFLRELNKRHAKFDTEAGVSIQMSANMGMRMAYSGLEYGDVAMVADLIQCSLSTEKTKPTTRDIEKYLSTLFAEDKYEELVENFIHTLETDSFLKMSLGLLEKQANQA